MDPTNWQQGGDPNRRAAAYYNPEQRHDYPSSSSQRPPLQLQQGFLTSWPEQQARVGQGGYIGNQRAPDVAGIPPDGNIVSGNNHLVPSGPSYNYHFSDSMATRPPMQNVIGPQDQYQRHPGSAAVFPAPGYNYNPVINPPAPGAGVYAQQRGSGTGLFPAPGHNPVINPPAPGAGVYAQQRGSGTGIFPAPGYNPVVNPPGAGVYAQQLGSGTGIFPAPGYDSNPHATVYQPQAQLNAQPQPGDATGFSAWGGNANNNPAGLIPPPANAIQGASAGHGPVAAVPNRTRPAVRNVSANDLWFDVEGARTPDDLAAIVNTVTNSGVSLFEVAQHPLGCTALMNLVNNLVALDLHPELLQRLFSCLIQGWVMEQNGPSMLRHFFTTLGYARCSIFIRELAVPRFAEMATSRNEYMSIMTCLDTEQRTELHDIIVNNTVVVAKHMFGSTLLQTVFENGHNNELRERITERVEQNLVELSVDRYGNKVVQACFVPRMMTPASPLLLERGLHAFLRLSGEQLQELVQNHPAHDVLCRILHGSISIQRPVPSAEAAQLATRIFNAGAFRNKMLIHLVFEVICKNNP